MGSPTVQQQWMRAIRDDRTLKAGGKAVLYTLATHMDADGANCRPGVNLLATESGMGRDAAFDNLEKAKQAGLVQVLQRWGASVYVPCVDGVPLIELAPSASPCRPTIPARIRQLVFERDEYCCVFCGAVGDLTLDHVFPWSLGGSDDEWNLQTLCRSCNSRKGAKV